MQEEDSPADKSKRRSSSLQTSKRKSSISPKESLFTLVNNDGNQIRRPKMTLSPLDSTNLLERQNTNPARKRLPNASGDKSGSHNTMFPPDLVQYQMFSGEIESAIDKHIEMKRQANKLCGDGQISKSMLNIKKTNIGQQEIQMKMYMIMQMVQANSQMLKVLGLFMNVKNRPVFAQVVHNTDDDSIYLLYIKDFSGFKVKEVQLN